MTMRCFQFKHTDPYFNLAAEEYLLKNFSDDIFLTWRSSEAIVTGKHQNTMAEMDYLYARESGITVARRLSGGGTVFHDPGNLNFTFIRNAVRTDQIRFGDFTDRVMQALKKLGMDVTADPHNAIFIDGKKISGCAGHVHRLRVMHHGTLLFNSRLDRLRKALHTHPERFEGKAVQSNRSRVTNIAHYLPGMDMERFERFIFEEIAGSYPDSRPAGLNPENMEAIAQLCREKYSRWEWIYGYSPRYCFRHELAAPDTRLSFSLAVEKGIIVRSEWQGCSPALARLLCRAAERQKHEYNALDVALSDIEKPLAQEGIPGKLLLEKLF